MSESLTAAAPALICFSHLRWDFVFQRPQHLMTRCASGRRVFFVEEPVYFEGIEPVLHVESRGPIVLCTPHLPIGLTEVRAVIAQRALVDELIARRGLADYVAWYYTPMALAFTDHLSPTAIVYDCMDELSAFKGAPKILKDRERTLMAAASVVFTGGRSLYEAKRSQHSNIHPFPSSVDVAHFAKARHVTHEPLDQAPISNPRLGFFGVIDERMDLHLLDAVAAARPDWHLVMLGPVVKIDEVSLPRRPNIHYLGGKKYDDLPNYVAGWDVALLPFARNEATRYISPTKTPEYMAAGKPVVSTSIRDVVRPYGQQGLARIADDGASFVAACEAAMAEDPVSRTERADAFLRQTSWDETWHGMWALVEEAIAGDKHTSAPIEVTSTSTSA
jgi:glycosyltransferase involved in cell wall biosynthesis